MPVKAYAACMAEAERRHSESGPVGEHVARNLRRIRDERRKTTEQLAKEVRELGIHMTASTVTKIERQGRRVFADELVFLALALNVSPVTLMLPDKDPRKPVLPTGETREPLSWQRAWRWMHAAAPLPGGPEEDDFHDFIDWLALNRPYMGPKEFQGFVGQYVGPGTTDQQAVDQFMNTKEEGEDGGPDS
jgi:transcriptional regulator with XRE-family HTH domain